jgi:hypothetical protein
MEFVFKIFKILKLCSYLLYKSYKCYKAYFVDIQIFRSSSSKVVFHGGRFPNFEHFENSLGVLLE